MNSIFDVLTHMNIFNILGKVLGQNRSFVANNHFPVPATMNEPQESNPIWYNEIEDDIKQLVHSSFPFTKLVYDPDLKTTTSILSGIAYYEIKIHTDDNYSFANNVSVPNNTTTTAAVNNSNILSSSSSTINNNNSTSTTQHNTINNTLTTTMSRSNNIPPCVAVGIAHPLHIDKLSSMPGWNDYSFAFHGDDGLFFHRQGHSGNYIYIYIL